MFFSDTPWKIYFHNMWFTEPIFRTEEVAVNESSWEDRQKVEGVKDGPIQNGIKWKMHLKMI
jgi:hypothetical protein